MVEALGLSAIVQVFQIRRIGIAAKAKRQTIIEVQVNEPKEDGIDLIHLVVVAV